MDIIVDRECLHSMSVDIVFKLRDAHVFGRVGETAWLSRDLQSSFDPRSFPASYLCEVRCALNKSPDFHVTRRRAHVPGNIACNMVNRDLFNADREGKEDTELSLITTEWP